MSLFDPGGLRSIQRFNCGQINSRRLSACNDRGTTQSGIAEEVFKRWA